MISTVVTRTDGAGTAPAAEKEQAKELTLRPNLFTGSGGTGHLILLYLKAIFLMLHGHLPPGIRIVAFDTDDENLSVPVHGRQVVLEPGDEFHYIGRVPVAGIVHNLANMPTIGDRLPSIAKLPAVNLTAGAGQVRPLGLLALLWHIETVKKALQDPLWELAHRENLGTLDGLRFDASRGVNVYQVGSLCGGTNSGQFLDIAYLVRSLLEALGDLADFSDIIGVGVLPDAFRNVRGPNLIPNTIAALHELDHCMVQGRFEASYRNGYVVDTVRPPFNIYYLLSAVAENSRTQLSLNELCWMAAMGLYHLAMSPIGKRDGSDSTNRLEVLAHHTDEGHGTFFASYGLAELIFPADDVATWCGYQHARGVIKHGLLASPDAGEVQGAVETTIQTQSLAVDSLLQALAVDDTGIPLAVELRPPAHLHNADAHTVPQIAQNYVQNYRRQRVEGDYRIWVRQNASRRQKELAQTLSAYIQAAIDDPTRGLLFALAFAKRLGEYLGDMSTALAAREKALQGQRSNVQSQTENSLGDLIQAPNANWFVRGGAVQKALGDYIEAVETLLQVQFEQAIYEQAITVIATVQEQVDGWGRDIEALVKRLETVDDQLGRQLGDLTTALLAPAKASRLALIDQPYLERLYRTHKPAVTATLGTLAGQGDRALHRWTGWAHDAVHREIVTVATEPFEPIRRMSIEEVIQDRADRMTPRQYADTLMEQAKAAWNLNEVLLPGGAANLARIEVLGVPNRENSIYANDAARLVSTADPHCITAFTRTAGAPFTASRRYLDYRRFYDAVGAKHRLHILPAFLAEGQSTKLAFALGHLFGYIIDRGVYYYYQPADDLADLIKLERGKSNAIEALGNHEGLVQEVMDRVEARIEDIGYDRAQQELAAFYEPSGDEDELSRELKRLVRDYAQQLGERRLV